MVTTENDGAGPRGLRRVLNGTVSAGPRGPRRVLNGIVWAVVSMMLFALTPILVRHLATDMTPIEIIFHRSAIGALGLGAYFLWHGIGGLRTGVLKLHFIRALVNFIAMTMWFQAILAMPLAEATALHFTLPLFTVILAALFLSERVGWRRWSATGIGFLGVLVVLRPGTASMELPALLVLGSAVFYAGAVIVIKMLTRTDTALAIGFYSNLLMVAVGAVPTIVLWQGPTWQEIPLLIMLAAVGTAAPYCLTRSLHLLEASLIAPMDFLRLPFTALAAWLIFAEVPDSWTWIGAAVIFGSTTYIARREATLHRRRAP